MRQARLLASISGLLLAGTALHTFTGCGKDAGDCALGLTCPGSADARNPACAGEPASKDGGPSDDCGIFADPTAPAGGDGSKASPFATLQAAVDQAATSGKPVFACGKTFAEKVRVPAGVALYGGLDCDHGWVWTGTPRTLLAPEASNTTADGSEIALALGGGTGTLLEDVEVRAPDGKLPGTSSIALLADGTTAALVRVSLTAGKGAAGAPGAKGSAAGLDGLPGVPGYSLCSAGATNAGPAGMSKACSTGTTRGGKGGDGGPMNGGTAAAAGAGDDGAPASSTLGKGGAGEGALACVAGTDGAGGADGLAATPLGAKSTGHIEASGFAGLPGNDGLDGLPGEGGGGGGGAKGVAMAACAGASTQDRAGATGGAGGTGGCGGERGRGGHAGGSSIALVSLGATLTLTDVDLGAGAGGDGGDGGDGQPGGAPGTNSTGGTGLGSLGKHGCAGGYGGAGGFGGPGGGGMGGHSLGIAYRGTAPIGGTVKTTGTPGAGGGGGVGNGSLGAKGNAGVVTSALAFE